MDRRLRKERHRSRVFRQAIYLFSKDHDAYEAIEFAKFSFQETVRSINENDLLSLEHDLINAFFLHVKEGCEKILKEFSGKISIDQVEQQLMLHFNHPALIAKLAEVLPSWASTYKLKVSDLEALSGDNQNVHTGPVNRQTNKSLDIMISFSVPKGQKTLDEILTAWVIDLNIGSEMYTVYSDMLAWAAKETIIEEDDYLYRRALRGLWSKIKTYNDVTRKELTKRLWEECSESLEMCAQGHLSRLANVLVGFDEDFKPELSLQDAMASIFNTDSSTEEKVAKAITVMNDMSVPEQERGPWLEAF